MARFLSFINHEGDSIALRIYAYSGIFWAVLLLSPNSMISTAEVTDSQRLYSYSKLVLLKK